MKVKIFDGYSNEVERNANDWLSKNKVDIIKTDWQVTSHEELDFCYFLIMYKEVSE